MNLDQALSSCHTQEAFGCALGSLKLALVGGFSGTAVAQSLLRAARAANIRCSTFDVASAYGKNRVLQALSWRLRDKKPLNFNQFCASVVMRCTDECPRVLVTTGSAPLTAAALDRLRSQGVVCMNYSTDDPWSPTMRAKWYLHALPHYDVVFTPRRSNIEDMLQLGCREVRYLPFGYDEFLFDSSLGRATAESPPEVLFVGGADRDRIAFMNEFVGDGPIVSLVGGYWPKDRGLRKYALGLKGPAELFALTKAAAVNLILVRRANRDGHVMRTFEAGAIGGCLAVEDTAEHREIFGSEGETVRYFRTPSEAAVLCRTLIGNSAERLRLSAAVKTRIREGANTYSDRLRTILAIAAEIRRGAHRRCGAPS